MDFSFFSVYRGSLKTMASGKAAEEEDIITDPLGVQDAAPKT